MILFITMAGTVLMVFLLLTCYRIFTILFRKEHDRDIHVTENREVISVVRTHSAPRWPTARQEKDKCESATAYEDNPAPPPYSAVVEEPRTQQSETWTLPSDSALLIQRT